MYVRFIILFSMVLFSCRDNSPSEYGREVLQKIEDYKLKKNTYPLTIEENLADEDYLNIKTNSFFYWVDSTQASFTLKVFREDGMSEIYDSKTKQWIVTDK